MTFIVLMDRPGKTASRQFYRLLNRAIKAGREIERIQQSCYLSQHESDRDFLVKLGEKHGFNVRAFKVVESRS